MKDGITTLQMKKSVVKALKGIKKYPKVTYSETTLDLIVVAKERKEFDLFVQKAQEHKMKELLAERD